MRDDNASQTPLVDLLRGVPKDAVNNYCHSTTHSQHIPVGRLCNEAADRIAALEAKVRKLEASVSWYSGRHEEDDKIIDGLETELTASRRQHQEEIARAITAEREACSERAADAVDAELETGDGESLREHVRNAVMRSNAEVSGAGTASAGLPG